MGLTLNALILTSSRFPSQLFMEAQCGNYVLKVIVKQHTYNYLSFLGF